ncbi:serine/threonine protein kinase [Thalassotalea hakodatensis]|uniref:serine/threonine protein kinase n=1 Tax=Thalassotalea hakodatensis TaxID=3030492 RepID=UPI00257264E2|nr:serine/threonine-protein kinase [Thalassotalea hakodatensis]
MDKNDFLNDLPQAKPSYTPAPDGQAPGEGLVIESGTLLAERYEVKERIGAGGMGAVFKAFDRNRDKDIAIKVLLPDLFSNEAAKERFTQEAQISSELSHPNIVNVFDIVVTGDLTFLTMELLEGQNLREYMDAQHRGMDQEEAIGIIQDVVKALEYAHQSMVHRDIKPENIFICDDGSIKLMDFGIAQAQSFSRASKVGMSLGTAYYMAPEQLKAKGKVDARADQYALAVLCYELLIGELPTGAVKKPHELKKDIPKKLSNVIMKGMEPSADERFTDVASFGKALAGKGRVSGGLSTKWLMGAGITVITFSAFFFGSGNSIDLDFSSSNTANTSSGSDETSFIDSIKETFFPDPAIEQEAIALSAELETLGKAIERSEKQLKEKKQETKAEVNRIESYLRTAKGEEKESLTSSLNQANVEAEASNNAYELFADLSTSSDQFIEGQKQKSTADALLKAGKFKQAIQEYNSAKIAFTKISSVSDDIHDYALNKAKLNAFKNDVITFNDNNKKVISDLSNFIEDVMEAFRLSDRQASKLNFKRALDFLSEFKAFSDNWVDIKKGYLDKNIENLIDIYKNCEVYAKRNQYDYCHIPDGLALAIAKEKNTISAYGQYAKGGGSYTDIADDMAADRVKELYSDDAFQVYLKWFPQGNYSESVSKVASDRRSKLDETVSKLKNWQHSYSAWLTFKREAQYYDRGLHNYYRDGDYVYINIRYDFGLDVKYKDYNKEENYAVYELLLTSEGQVKHSESYRDKYFHEMLLRFELILEFDDNYAVSFNDGKVLNCKNGGDDSKYYNRYVDYLMKCPALGADIEIVRWLPIKSLGFSHSAGFNLIGYNSTFLKNTTIPLSIKGK